MTYYEILGVARSATADEIRMAYRKLAMKHHPDRNQGNKASEQKFKDITNAYDVLQDDVKRRQYDLTLDVQRPAGRAKRFIEEFFTTGWMGGVSNTGSSASAMDGAFGGHSRWRPIFLNPNVAEPGHRGAAGTKTCPSCDGHGIISAEVGFFTVRQTCSQCEGRGEL